MKLASHLTRSTQIFIGLSLLYAVMGYLLPGSSITKAAYHLSDVEYTSLLLIVKVPIIATWCVAYYGYRRLLGYSEKIKHTAEGNGFTSITKGMAWIAWGFPIPALISALLTAFSNQHPSLLTFALVFTNYLYLLITLVAFIYITLGIHSLAAHSKVQLTSRHIHAMALTLVVVSVIFCVLIASRLHGNGAGDSFNAHYLPTWMVWTTIVIPYLYAWFVGIFAALELVLISRQAPGIIYRRSLQLLAVGLMLIIVSMSGWQYFRAIVPRTGHLTIGLALVTVYAIYFVNAIGFVLLAAGARRLKRIEDI